MRAASLAESIGRCHAQHPHELIRGVAHVAAPGTRPKFRIDPTAPPAPPPQAPAAQVRPAPPASSPPSSLPVPSPSRRKWLLAGGVIAALLVVAAAVAVFGYGVGGLVYPTKYLLSKSETPHGVTLAPPRSSSFGGEVEPGNNPARFTDAGLDSLRTPDGTRPKEGWAEAFDVATVGASQVTLLALKFGSNEAADGWAQTASALCATGNGYGALLRDGDVVVLVTANDRAGNVYTGKIVAALQQKASGLTPLCRSPATP